jgi:hypothetical protein
LVPAGAGLAHASDIPAASRREARLLIS